MVLPNNNIEDLIPELCELWNNTLGDPTIKVAVLDGPVDNTHPALVSANLKIEEAYSGSKINKSRNAIEHGTHVSSIIFGQHNSKFFNKTF